MAADVEILRAKTPAVAGAAALNAFRSAVIASGMTCVETTAYQGRSQWLALFGVGAAAHAAARDLQVKRGGKALLFDLGYFGRMKTGGYVRASIDTDHPQRLLDLVAPDAKRWARHRIDLREDYDAHGPIVIAGLGRKTRAYLNQYAWEVCTFRRIRQRFPDRRVIYRPKRDIDEVQLPCERDGKSPIEVVLKGASLVVCRHSNVAVDAVVAGVPFEAEDGAAMWLVGKEYTRANRLEFLQRLIRFQWMPHEMDEAWRFYREIACV